MAAEAINTSIKARTGLLEAVPEIEKRAATWTAKNAAGFCTFWGRPARLERKGILTEAFRVFIPLGRQGAGKKRRCGKLAVGGSGNCNQSWGCSCPLL